MARKKILRIAVNILGVIGVLALAGGGLYLAFLANFHPPPPAFDFPKPANALEAQRQDVTQFERLIALDRSFSVPARAEAARRIAALKDGDKVLDRGEFRARLLEIVALADNGHSDLHSDKGERGTAVPFRVTLFSDGLYILRAKGTATDLLGARVESIEGKAPEEVLTTLERLHGGTKGWRRIYASAFVTSPGLLHGMGIAASPVRTTWTFLIPTGKLVERTFAAEQPKEEDPGGIGSRWLSPLLDNDEPKAWKPFLANENGLPVTLKNFDHVFRRIWLNGSCTLLIQMKAIQNVEDEKIGDFLRATEADMRSRKPCELILDMRFNTGGDYTNTATFAARLPELVQPTARVYILTTAQTFSAAITTVAFIKQAFGSRAIILGEPVGDRLRFWAEGTEGCLPHEKLCYYYMRGMHDYAHPCTDWAKCFWLNWIFPVRVDSLAPDETITMSFADYVAGHDPVFERAVALASARSH